MTTSIPLTIKIQTPPTLPITILPKPQSTYSIEPGTQLILVFEVSDPQNVEIEITIDLGLAKTFAV